MIPTEYPHLSVAAMTHPGETGKNNEDNYSVTTYRRSKKDRTPILLAIVADGIGGHQAGEVASKLTCDMIIETLTRSNGRDPRLQLRNAIIRAGRAIAMEAEKGSEQRGMGSTVVIAWVIGKRLYSAWVGDSRMYFIRRGRLRRITVDHTWVQEAIEHGIIAPDQARTHPNAHVLRRHLGGAEDPVPDLRLMLSEKDDETRAMANQGLRLQTGDRLLLCSDGLTDLVDDHEICDVVMKQPPKEAVRNLVNLARARGGHDNITIVLLTVPQTAPSGHSLLRRLLVPLIGAAGLLGIIALGLAASWYFGFGPLARTTPTPSPTPTILQTTIAQPTETPFEPPLTATLTASPSPEVTATPAPSNTPAATPTASATAVALPTIGP